jgi:hypothetical protein
MRHFSALILLLLTTLTAALPVVAQVSPVWDDDQRAVLEAVVDRNQEWAQNDSERFMDLAYDRWLPSYRRCLE